MVGGSRGLGEDVARRLHLSGAQTIAISRTVDPSHEVPWQQAALDANDEVAVAQFFKERADLITERNLLVNFAGLRYNTPVADSDPTLWREAVDSSLTTTYLMTREFAKSCEGRSGAIVNMASIHADGAAGGRSAYAAAKAAVKQLTAVTAVELAPRIRVNCVAPGFIATDASNAMIDSGELDGKAIIRRTPMGRLGSAEEVTDAVMFLLSDSSSFITGETLRIDGGWLRHSRVSE